MVFTPFFGHLAAQAQVAQGFFLVFAFELAQDMDALLGEGVGIGLRR